MTQLFNQRALQKRHQPGDRNGPVTLLSPPLRVTLGIGLLIAIGGVLWSILARVPVSVQGTGVLLPVGSINPKMSPSAGIAVWMFDQPTQEWQARAQEFIYRPEDFKRADVIELAEDILKAAEPARETSVSGISDTKAGAFSRNLSRVYTGLNVKAGQLLIWIQAPKRRDKLNGTLQLTRTALEGSKRERENITLKQQALGRELENNRSVLAGMKELERKGFVKKTTVFEEQAKADSIESQLLSLESELIKLGEKDAEGFQQLRNELTTLISTEMVFAPRTLHISQVIPNNGESVIEGQVLLELSDDPLESPVFVPVYLSPKETAQVSPGMDALVTPVGFNRSEVGGIRARVVSLEKLPSGIEDITAKVGVKTIAELIMNREPSPTLVVLALERAKNEAPRNGGGYLWSSKGELPFSPTPGDQLDVQITTRKIAPIELAIPILRDFFGITPPKSRQNG